MPILKRIAALEARLGAIDGQNVDWSIGLDHNLTDRDGRINTLRNRLAAQAGKGGRPDLTDLEARIMNLDGKHADRAKPFEERLTDLANRINIPHVDRIPRRKNRP